MKTNTAPTGENCIRAALLKTRHSMDTVFALVPSNAWLDRPVPERHRLVFYLGHVEAFDWNLIRSELHLQSFQSTFDRLFAFGIDPKAGQLPDDVPSDWPSIKEISDYTALVRRRIDEVVQHIPPVVPHIAMERRFRRQEPDHCSRTTASGSVAGSQREVVRRHHAAVKSSSSGSARSCRRGSA